MSSHHAALLHEPSQGTVQVEGVKGVLRAGPYSKDKICIGDCKLVMTQCGYLQEEIDNAQPTRSNGRNEKNLLPNCIQPADAYYTRCREGEEGEQKEQHKKGEVEVGQLWLHNIGLRRAARAVCTPIDACTTWMPNTILIKL